jgi:hypothetical protein
MPEAAASLIRFTERAPAPRQENSSERRDFIRRSNCGGVMRELLRICSWDQVYSSASALRVPASAVSSIVPPQHE